MFCISQTKIIVLTFQNQISYVFMYSNICPIESVLTAYWKNVKLAKVTRRKSVSPSPIFCCNFSIWRWTENIFLSCFMYTGPLTPPRGKAIYLKSLPSCGFSCSPPVSLRRQLSWTYQLQGWYKARCTAYPQFLKLRGHWATQLFLHIYGNKAASSIP